MFWDFSNCGPFLCKSQRAACKDHSDTNLVKYIYSRVRNIAQPQTLRIKNVIGRSKIISMPMSFSAKTFIDQIVLTSK